MSTPQKFASKFIKKEKRAKDTCSFFFEKASDFDYIAGQYVKIKLDIEDPDERGTSRFFTLSSSPTEKNLTITTKIIESSFKKKFDALREGEEVKMHGPFGDFILPEEKKPTVFLAGGIGITPFRSISIFANEKNLDFKITLLASFSTIDEIIFEEELDGLKSEKFQYIKTITHGEDSNWDGEIGRIDKEKIEKYADKVEDNLYYIAGPAVFVEAMEKILIEEMQIQEKNIKSEDFPGY